MDERGNGALKSLCCAGECVSMWKESRPPKVTRPFPFIVQGRDGLLHGEREKRVKREELGGGRLSTPPFLLSVLVGPPNGDGGCPFSSLPLC